VGCGTARTIHEADPVESLHHGAVCTEVAPSRVSLPNSLAAGRLARRFVEQHWCPTHCKDDLSRVHLLVTELVINAVEHGGPPILLTLECTGGGVVEVRVSDGGTALPRPQVSPPDAEGGRGVQLVELLSEQWGIHHHRAPARTASPVGTPSTGTAASGGTRVTPGVHHRPDRGFGPDRDVFADQDGVAKTVWCRLLAA
jgi:anti-sigma regulatory factor (Ser/Thr protein kinase)